MDKFQDKLEQLLARSSLNIVRMQPFAIDDRVVSPRGEALIVSMRVDKHVLVRQLDGAVYAFALSELEHSKQTRIWPMLDIRPFTGEYDPLPPEHPKYRKPKT